MDWVWVVVVLDVQALCLQTGLSPVTKQAWPFQMEDKKSSKPRVKMTNTYKKGSRICSAHTQTHYCISLYLYIYIHRFTPQCLQSVSTLWNRLPV